MSGPEIRAVVFDVNGTLVDIRTDEHDQRLFRAAARVLGYHGIDLHHGQVRELYFRYLDEQRAASPEAHPEFDAVAIWARLLVEHASGYTRARPAAERAQLPLFLAELYRGLSRRRLRRYPGVREVLDVLRERVPLAVVTDAQSAYARAELHQVGLLEYFDPIVVSGDHGFRKPDPRLFRMAVDALGVAPGAALHVGNDVYRDIFGAREAGLRTALLTSDQGDRTYRDTVPDHVIDDHRELLALVGSATPGRSARHGLSPGWWRSTRR